MNNRTLLFKKLSTKLCDTYLFILIKQFKLRKKRGLPFNIFSINSNVGRRSLIQKKQDFLHRLANDLNPELESIFLSNKQSQCQLDPRRMPIMPSLQKKKRYMVIFVI